MSQYAAALQFLTDRTNFETFRTIPYSQMADGLVRLREILERLGRPDRSMRVIHLAGTKGKGTTAVMIERMLRASGFSTGLFTSPHLLNIEERFALNGLPAPPDELAEVLLDLRDRLDRLFPGENRPPLTFFELALLAAFLLFRKKRVDWAILETGLGGRFDATNVCDPELCIITSIGYDHTEQLGGTLGEIASEKAGIIKYRVPVVAAAGLWPSEIPPPSPLPPQKTDGPFSLGAEFLNRKNRFMAELPEIFHRTVRSVEAVAEADRVIRETARQFDAPFEVVDDSTPPKAIFPTKPIPTLKIPGHAPRLNARLAVAALEIVENQRKIRIDWSAAMTALQNVTIPGRFERLSERPWIVADGGHNRQSAAALVEALREELCRFPDLAGFSGLSQSGAEKFQKIVVLATSQGKDVVGILCEFFPFFDKIILTSYGESERSLPVSELAAAAESILNAHPRRGDFAGKIEIEPDFAAWKPGSDPMARYVLTGSFYFAAQAAQRFGPLNASGGPTLQAKHGAKRLI